MVTRVVSSPSYLPGHKMDTLTSSTVQYATKFIYVSLVIYMHVISLVYFILS